MENDIGEWRVLFPEVPGCEAKASAWTTPSLPLRARSGDAFKNR
jgi:hypothetical protein